MKTARLKNRHFLILVILLAAVLSPAARLIAGEMWVYYEAESSVFKARVPEVRKTTISDFMIADTTAVSSEETAALLDQRPFKNVLKSYIIKYDQTIGPGLNDDETNLLLDRELGFYEDYYKGAFNGIVKDKVKKNILSYVGGEIYIQFKDPKLGDQSIKVRVIISPSTRLEQIVVGPDEAINSFKTRDFFNSLTFEDGLIVTKDLMKDKWKAISSPLDVFTYHAPEVTKPYFPEAPITHYDPTNEMVTLIFKDPVRNQSIFYNIYSYTFSKALSFTDIETILVKRHISNHRNDVKGIQFKKVVGGGDERVLETTYNMTPPADFPYLNTVKLKAVAKKGTIMVQEVLSSQPLVLSDFVTNVGNLIEFHPELYYVPKDEPAPPATPPATPQATQSLPPAAAPPPAPAATTPAPAAPATP